MLEEWKTLVYDRVEYSMFEVSNTGQIRNVSTGNVLRQELAINGYYRIRHIKLEDGTKKNFRVHRAVACTFIPNPDNKTDVNHIDGNKLNNNVNNLEWLSHSDNISHSYTINKQRKSNTRLTLEQIQWIRENYIKGDRVFGCYGIGRTLDVDPKTVRNVIQNKTYKKLEV